MVPSPRLLGSYCGHPPEAFIVVVFVFYATHRLLRPSCRRRFLWATPHPRSCEGTTAPSRSPPATTCGVRRPRRQRAGSPRSRKLQKKNSEKFSSIFQFFNFSAFSAFGTCRNPPKPNFVSMNSLKESYGDGLELEIQTSRPPKNTKRAFLVGGILVRIRRFLMFHLRFPS